MSTQDDAIREVSAIAECICFGELTPTQTTRLHELITSSEECRRQYIYHVHLHAGLKYCLTTPTTDPSGPGSPMVEPTQDPLSPESPTSPLLGFLGGCWQWGTTFLSNPTRLSLAISSLTMTFVLLILAVLIAPHYDSISNNYVGEPEIALEHVAQLTDAVDCKWSDPKSAPDSYSFLFPDDLLDLESGLVEITFNSGAKVILQGPVTFTPTSDSAGYLKLGRMTANVPKRAIGFTIETSAVRVTDLGTEFGVLAEENYVAQVHVFQGRVAAEPLKDKKPCGKSVELTKNQAVQFGAAGQVIQEVEGSSKEFVRQMPISVGNYESVILADRPVGYWRFNETSLDALAKDLSPNANHTAYPSSASLGSDSFSNQLEKAVEFGSKGLQVAAKGCEFQFANGFTIEAWVKVGFDEGKVGRIISSHDFDLRYDARKSHGSPGWKKGFSFTVYNHRAYFFGVVPPKNRWVHLVCTLDRANTASLYVNGRFKKQMRSDIKWAPANKCIGIGGPPAFWDLQFDVKPKGVWQGGIDEVAIYDRALTPNTVKRHFIEATKPNAEFGNQQTTR